MTDRLWVLSPADFDLWDQCQRCFYLAAATGFPRPAAPTRAGSLIGRRLLSGLQGARADKIADGMPSGLIDVGRHALRSSPLAVQVPDRIYRCVVQGTLDLVLRLDGDACALMDVAIGTPDEAALAIHSRRLHAWAQAVESPDARDGRAVRALGVLAFEPEGDGPSAVTGAWRWTPIARDEPGFYGFLAEALLLLDRPVPPGGTPLCSWCVYRDVSRRTGY